MTLIRHQYNFRDKQLLDTPPGFVAGIECEIENILNTPEKISLFKTVPDGSLRNHGLEFVSDPLPMEKLLTSFTKLHSTITYGDLAFSTRTSTHVHINCRHMEDTAVKTMFLLYALLEPFFFMMVAPNRRDNIHCVALTDTYLPKIYNKSIFSLITRWHKYTALNLLPLATQGSVEFRHLQGTSCVNTLKAWLMCLDNLQKLALDLGDMKPTLLSLSSLEEWRGIIFKHVPIVMSCDVETVTENTLLDVKLSFLGN